MLCTSLEPPVVKSGGKVKNPAEDIILAKSALVFHDSKNFDSSNGMLDLDACPGYFYMSSCTTVSPPRSSRSLLKAATSEAGSIPASSMAAPSACVSVCIHWPHSWLMSKHAAW